MSHVRAGLRTTIVWNLSVFLSTMGLVGGTQLCAAELLVAAASDLAPVMAEITPILKQKKQLTLRVSIGSSGQLARQIEQGAPFDIFLSADELLPRQIANSGLGDPATLQTYAIGHLALWSKAGTVRRLEDLSSKDVRRVAMANPIHAPYGRLGKQALVRAGVWPAVEPKLVLAETVRQTVQFATTGNVDAAVTAWTLVRDKGGILLPDRMAQAGIVLRGAKNAVAAAEFLDFLRSSAGKEILARHGLFPPPQTLLQELKNENGDGKGGGPNEQTEKPEGLRPTKKRNKD